MTTGAEAAILGVVQGLTEFLPVSSSGHLVLAQEIMGTQSEDILFELAVHIGTLLPILLVYFSDLWGMAKAPFVERGPLSERPETRLMLLLIVGCIPTAMIGLGFLEFFSSILAKQAGDFSFAAVPAAPFPGLVKRLADVLVVSMRSGLLQTGFPYCEP